MRLGRFGGFALSHTLRWLLCRTQHERDLERQAQRMSESKCERGRVYRSRHVAWCHDTVLKAVETAMAVAHQRELTMGRVPAGVLAEARVVFVSRLPADAGFAAMPRLRAEQPTAEVEDEGVAESVAPPQEPPVVACAGVVGAAQDNGLYEAHGQPRNVHAFDDVAEDEHKLADDIAAAQAEQVANAPRTSAQAAAVELMNAASFEQYITHSGGWKPAAAATPPEVPSAESEDAGGKGKKGKASSEELDPEFAHVHLAVPGGEADGSTEWVLGGVARAVELAATPPPPHPPLPPVPRFGIRAVLFGSPIAGKSTQAALLAAKHSLRVLDPEVLLVEALALAEEGATSERVVGGGVRSAGFHSEDVRDGWTQEALAVGTAALQSLQDGGIVADALYVRLIVAAICAMGTSWGRPPTAPFNHLPACRADWQGWLLDGFPQTKTQAALLEAALTGWAPSTPAEPTNQQRWARSMALSQPLPRDPLALDAPYGVNAALHVALAPERAARRALGRRLDPVTGTEYHIDRNPPPHDKVMKHMLEEVPDQNNTPATLSDMMEAVQSNLSDLQQWYSQNPAQLCCVHAAQAPAAPTGTGIKASIGVLDEEAVAERLSSELLSAVDSDAEPLVLSAPPEAGAAAQDAVSAATPPADDTQGADGAPAEAATAADHADDAGEDGNECKGADTSPSPPGEADESKDSSTDGNERPLLPPVSDTSRLAAAAAPWNAAVARYGGAVEREIACLRAERSASTERLAVTRRRFTQFLLRAAPRKQALVEAFQADFNAMDNDMRYQPLVKDELHMRTEETARALWAVISTRRAACEDELQALRSDSWLTDVQGSIADHYAACAQLEVDRFAAGRRVVLEYFAAASGRTPLVASDGCEEGADHGLSAACVDVSGLLAAPEGACPQRCARVCLCC